MISNFELACQRYERRQAVIRALIRLPVIALALYGAYRLVCG